MTLPLSGFVAAGQEISLSQFCWVLFDTGSRGYFKLDASHLGEDGHSALDELGRLSDVFFGGGEDVALVLGAGRSATDTFVLPLSAKWLSHPPHGTAVMAEPPARLPRRPDLNLIVLGNCWLQAVALTFEPRRPRSLASKNWSAAASDWPGDGQSEGTAFLSHLDDVGERSATFRGWSAASESQRSPVQRRTDRSHVEGGRGGQVGDVLGLLETASLADEALGGLASSDVQGHGANLVLRLRWMQIALDASEDASVARETTDPRALGVPTLTLGIDTEDGESSRVCAILDTGSGLSFLPGVRIKESAGDRCDSAESCGCVGGGTVREIWNRFRASFATAETGESDDLVRCKSENEVGQLRDARCNPCCRRCCLAAGVTPETRVRCSLALCSGVVAFVPRFARCSFPDIYRRSDHGVGVDNLSLRIFLADATPLCEPSPRLGVLGCWYWMRPMRSSSGESLTYATSLPYYVLSSLGQLDNPLLNTMTLKFWRSDLSKVVLRKTPPLHNPGVLRRIEIAPSESRPSAAPVDFAGHVVGTVMSATETSRRETVDVPPKLALRNTERTSERMSGSDIVISQHLWDDVWRKIWTTLGLVSLLSALLIWLIFDIRNPKMKTSIEKAHS